MFWDYIAAVANASWQFAKGGGEMIEFIICAAFFFAPKFFKQREATGIEFEKSIRKILVFKFLTNDRWRASIVVFSCFTFHVLVIAPYQVYKATRADNSKAEKISQWQPPELEKITYQVLVKYGRSFGLYEIKDLTNPVPFEVNNSPYMGQLQGYHPFSCHVKNNRVYVDLQIATQTKPIQIKDGKIIDLPTGWQVNGNSNSFEIVSGEEIPVFQEFYPGTNQVIIKGTIRSGDKVFFLDTDNSVLISDFQSYLLGELFNRAKLAQHFTYPASEFPGVLFNK